MGIKVVADLCVPARGTVETVYPEVYIANKYVVLWARDLEKDKDSKKEYASLSAEGRISRHEIEWVLN